jgi:hypothetical protein
VSKSDLLQLLAVGEVDTSAVGVAERVKSESRSHLVISNKPVATRVAFFPVVFGASSAGSAEHRRLPFRAIIAMDNPGDDQCILLVDELSDDEPLMTVAHD